MSKTNPIRPVFMGGTLAEHKIFVLSVCRFDHFSIPLSLFHYVTWSVGHISMYVIAERVFGPVGGMVLAFLLTAWAMRMDVRFGALFGVLETSYALLASVLLSQVVVSGTSTSTTVWLALATLLTSLAVEVGSHFVVQGHPPGPPSKKVFFVPNGEFAMIGLYFAIVFGLFFLNLDLAMRFLGYRSDDHKRVNEITNDWHRGAAAEAAAKPRIRDWHLRVIEAQSV